MVDAPVSFNYPIGDVVFELFYYLNTAVGTATINNKLEVVEALSNYAFNSIMKSVELLKLTVITDNL